MGLFRDTGTCSICGSKDGKKVKDGFICPECMQKAGLFKDRKILMDRNHQVSIIKEAIKKNEIFQEKQRKRQEIFNVTLNVENQIDVDEHNGLFRKKKSSDIYSFEEILDYEILENGGSVASGGIGRAVVGGVLAGGVGAIVGGSTRKQKNICNSLELRVGIKDSYDQNLYFKFLTSDTDRSTKFYELNMEYANNLMSFFNNEVKKIEDQNNASNDSKMNPYEELIELKKLLDLGIVTQAEFDQKKKQLLNL